MSSKAVGRARLTMISAAARFELEYGDGLAAENTARRPPIHERVFSKPKIQGAMTRIDGTAPSRTVSV